jgi:transforming growth factor-beta-induced protein
MSPKTTIFALLAGLALLSAGPAAQAGSCGGSHAKAGKDIVSTAVAAGSFKTLVAAVQAAGLQETLEGDGPFTVFAPNDAAFAKLGKGTIEGLLKDKTALRRILTYHVVPGKVPASKVVNSRWLETAEGQSLMVKTDDTGVRIDGARILATDIPASNGIIHVIDTVVLPRKDIVQTAAEARAFGTLLAAAKAADLAGTLSGKGPFTVFAPTDEAFGKLPAGTVEGLLKDKPKLRGILLYHVVPGRVLADQIAMGTSKVGTAQGSKVKITRGKDGNVYVNGAKVIRTDMIAGNGVIHVLDAVILPPAQ